MRRVGGYVEVDMKGLKINVGGTVDGLYARLQKCLATNKLIILKNVFYNTMEYSPMPAVCAQAENVIYFDTATGSYNVTNEDVVSANA